MKVLWRHCLLESTSTHSLFTRRKRNKTLGNINNITISSKHLIHQTTNLELFCYYTSYHITRVFCTYKLIIEKKTTKIETNHNRLQIMLPEHHLVSPL